jgi:hypothetical protein
MTKFFELLGGGLLVLMMYVHYVGWGALDRDVVAGVPKSVRDNPGSYRSHYARSVHYIGGK